MVCLWVNTIPTTLIYNLYKVKPPVTMNLVLSLNCLPTLDPNNGDGVSCTLPISSYEHIQEGPRRVISIKVEPKRDYEVYVNTSLL